MTSKSTNNLISESSPYLLQHAYNPVKWFAWGEDALEKAKQEDKPILVSIGYAACHWCHVMERESFENEELAALMNQHFICIKIDREERPEIDQIYMDAVQAMGIGGGWPLNVFLTPDQKPFYGGTYFPPSRWQQVLTHLGEAFKTKRQEIEKSAQELTASLNKSVSEKFNLIGNSSPYNQKQADEMFQKLAQNFDTLKGGMDKSPKFPMPSIYTFLLRYYDITGNKAALNQIQLTLDQMAMGGIYDQIGGGFARYSTDAFWFAPHFEKMLYDNAQLISLYCEGYNISKEHRYKQVVYESIEFLERELLNENGGFYAALDADSEGVEGKFYSWKYSELQTVLGNDFPLFADYYSVTEEGNWEEGTNILHTKHISEEAFCNKNNLALADFRNKQHQWKTQLLEIRSKRIRPSLDTKILASWNGLTLSALVQAAKVFDENAFLELALKNANFIDQQLSESGKLWHTFQNGERKINGYLEDYAAVIEGYINLYQGCFDEIWLKKAAQLMDYVLNNFLDIEDDLFFFTDKNSEQLITRKKEIFDNVIPASNSMMARNLYHLGLLLDKENYLNLAEKMLLKVNKLLKTEVQFLSNWGAFLTEKVSETTEIVIVGNDYKNIATAFEKYFIPNKIIVATKEKSELPLLKNREAINGKTTIYICRNKTCQLPVFTVEEGLKLISESN